MADYLTKAQQMHVFKIELLRAASNNGTGPINYDQIGLYPILGSSKGWSPFYILVEIVRKFGLAQDMKQLDALIYDADHDGALSWSCKISIFQRKYFTWLHIFQEQITLNWKILLNWWAVWANQLMRWSPCSTLLWVDRSSLSLAEIKHSHPLHIGNTHELISDVTRGAWAGAARSPGKTYVTV